MDSLLLFSLFSLISSISGVFVILGDTFEFTKTASCQKKGAKLWHPLDSSRTVLVARWDDDWIPSQYYEDRIDLNASVVLKNININDNGLFELSCEETPTQLDVVRASEVSVSAGGAVSFQFDYVTSGAQGKFRLVRNRETVCELDLSSGTITYGTGSEERLSLPSDWRRHGDLTPTLQRVKPEDQGDYFAYVEGKDGKRRSLSAWRIKVLDQDPDQTTATPGTADETTDTRTHLDPPLNMTQRAAEEQIGFIVSIIFNVLLFSASVIFCALWRVNVFKARRAASVRPPADTEMEPLGGDPDHVPNGGAHSAEP